VNTTHVSKKTDASVIILTIAVLRCLDAEDCLLIWEGDATKKFFDLNTLGAFDFISWLAHDDLQKLIEYSKSQADEFDAPLSPDLMD
jgi:hypothetical protein